MAEPTVTRGDSRAGPVAAAIVVAALLTGGVFLWPAIEAELDPAPEQRPDLAAPPKASRALRQSLPPPTGSASSVENAESKAPSGSARHIEMTVRAELAGNPSLAPAERAGLQIELARSLAAQGKLDEAEVYFHQAIATGRDASPEVAERAERAFARFTREGAETAVAPSAPRAQTRSGSTPPVPVPPAPARVPESTAVMERTEFMERLEAQAKADRHEAVQKLLAARLQALIAEEQYGLEFADAAYLLGHALAAAGEPGRAAEFFLNAAQAANTERPHGRMLAAAAEGAALTLAGGEPLAQGIGTSPPPALPPGQAIFKVGALNVVRLDLGDGFELTGDGGREGASPSWSPGTIRLRSAPEPGLSSFPSFTGTSQRFGVFRLGLSANPEFRFALDIPANGNPVLHLDRNRNGDLTDDGEPLVNRGTGWFASAISFPASDVLPAFEDALGKPFDIWFFTNDSMRKKDLMTFYTRSALRGRVWFDGRERLAYVTESFKNDGDFLNDGVQVDLNGDGKVSNQERVLPGQEIERGGQRYRFETRW